MGRLVRFCGSEDGAVTTDWVALTAGVLLVGIMAVFAIYGGEGSENLRSTIEESLMSYSSEEATFDVVTIDGGGSTTIGN